jgi:hypothetical protein
MLRYMINLDEKPFFITLIKDKTKLNAQKERNSFIIFKKHLLITYVFFLKSASAGVRSYKRFLR